MGRRLTSLPEAARELGIHESTVRRWIKAGLLPADRIGPGRRYRIARHDLDRLRKSVRNGGPMDR
ncbi:MAG: helix-turn-helix domain-containing protein [Chloroflexi bacterium]|nr:helix-turn-helix domain-containing protein [Chloroflexota bacterium]